MANNKYREIRDDKNLSREDVCSMAEQLGMGGIDITRLGRIETGKFPIHRDEVILLSKIYKEPTLCNYYCSHDCPIGRRYVPPIELKDLEKIVLSMIASLNSIHNRQERLIEITSDGQIAADEMEDFQKIRDELERISIAVETLQFWTEKNLGTIQK